MSMHFKVCTTDEDFANVGLFFLQFKRDLHPSFETIDFVSAFYSHVTEAQIIMVTNAEQRVIGMTAFYIGTKEQEYSDKEIVYVDIAIGDRAYRGTRLFVDGLLFLIEHVTDNHPEVKELRLAALTDNKYLCRLYSKFTASSYQREGIAGEETVFCNNIFQIKTTLAKFQRV